MEKPPRKKIWPILVVILLAVFLRVWALAQLPEDFDEPVYLQTAFDYAALLKDGDFHGMIDYAGVQEHPAFVKLLYSGTVLALGKLASWVNAFYASRVLSAICGVLAVALLVFFVDPLSGGLLAIHTLAVKYTSQVYLEAVPHFMTIAAVLTFLRVDRERASRWLWLSAVALGASAASKYSYLPVILVVLAYLAFFEKKIHWHLFLGYAATVLLTFFVLDIYIWHEPFHRLISSLTYHIGYSQGAHVEEVGYPWFQPFIWIFTSPPASWHAGIFFWGFDGVISIAAILGIWREWKERRWLVVWLAFGVLFLLLWPTKWPQYALTVTPPLCIMAAASFRWVVKWAREQESYWDYVKELVPKPGKGFWIALAAFLIFVASIYLSGAIRLALGRIGWSHITAESSYLPSNTVNVLLPLEAGHMLLGTDKGAAIWSPAKSTDEPPEWILFDTSNSGLVNNQVLAMTRDDHGTLWFGTAAGISSYNYFEWDSFLADEIGLPSIRTLSLAPAPGGTVYAGTLRGAAVWDGSSWSPLEQLSEQTVFGITTDASQTYFGTSTGMYRYDSQTETWEFFPADSAVTHILVDSSGTIWAATSGSGLAKLVGADWEYFRPSNSGIPHNFVHWVTEIEPGFLWLGTSYPSASGGTVATFDGERWHAFQKDNSGSSLSEPLVIVLGEGNQVWIGTRSQGIDLYQIRR